MGWARHAGTGRPRQPFPLPPPCLFCRQIALHAAPVDSACLTNPPLRTACRSMARAHCHGRGEGVRRRSSPQHTDLRVRRGSGCLPTETEQRKEGSGRERRPLLAAKQERGAAAIEQARAEAGRVFKVWARRANTYACCAWPVRRGCAGRWLPCALPQSRVGRGGASGSMPLLYFFFWIVSCLDRRGCLPTGAESSRKGLCLPRPDVCALPRRSYTYIHIHA